MSFSVFKGRVTMVENTFDSDNATTTSLVVKPADLTNSLRLSCGFLSSRIIKVSHDKILSKTSFPFLLEVIWAALYVELPRSNPRTEGMDIFYRFVSPKTIVVSKTVCALNIFVAASVVVGTYFLKTIITRIPTVSPPI